MANTPQAKKRARQAEKRRIRNAAHRSNLRTFIKKVIAAIRSGDQEQARAAFKIAQPVIDSAVNKGIIHKNKAARSKSRLSAKVKAMGTGETMVFAKPPGSAAQPPLADAPSP